MCNKIAKAEAQCSRCRKSLRTGKHATIKYAVRAINLSKRIPSIDATIVLRGTTRTQCIYAKGADGHYVNKDMMMIKLTHAT